MSASPSAREGMAAFLEKRKPVWPTEVPVAEINGQRIFYTDSVGDGPAVLSRTAS